LRTEVELKLNISSGDATRVRSHPSIKAACIGKPVTHKITTIYFDTPDLKLMDYGISFRIRRSYGKWIQSIKATGSALAGLHQRLEWESSIIAGRPDFTKINEPALITLFEDQALRDALLPIFKTEVMRSEWQLAFDNGDQVELALDSGQLAAGESHEPISEIELELTSGNTGRLYDLALELQKVIPLRLENLSKAQRGYAYYRARPISVINAQLPKLKSDAEANSAFKQIAWECINHLQGNQDVVLYGTDVEGVHQMRVALRRLRSAFNIFRKVLGREESAPLLAELVWIADALGKARDLDVVLTETLSPLISKLENHAGLLKLRDKALALQAETYNELRTTLASQRYQCFLLTMATWLENQRWRKRTKNSKQVKVLDIATATLTKRHKQLRLSGKSLAYMKPEERHATRIAAKKMRYAAEFFACLYSTKKSRSFISSLSLLQDCLGVLNDISTTEKLMHGLIGSSHSSTLNDAKHILDGWNACSALHSLARLDEVWQSFISEKRFWH
jgi:triphosphatase